MNRIKKYITIIIAEAVKNLPFLKFINPRILSGINKGLRWNPLVMDNSYVLGIYDVEGQEVFRKYLNKGEVAYDIGANVGFHTLAASGLVGEKGKVYSFEPFPLNIKFLQKHVKINNIKNVDIMEVAVSNKQGTVFFTSNFNKEGNTYVDSKYSSSLDQRFEVKTHSLDFLVKENIILPPNFIKIDAEGAEYDILIGAERILKEFRPKIVLATHDNHVEGISKKCCNFLTELNYSVKVFVINHQNPLMVDYIAVPKE